MEHLLGIKLKVHSYSMSEQKLIQKPKSKLFAWHDENILEFMALFIKAFLKDMDLFMKVFWKCTDFFTSAILQSSNLCIKIMYYF